jgi:hypothetical protein
MNNPTGRYNDEEDSEPLYTYMMSLTIRDVRINDLGNYSCVARNSLGTVRGTISLKRKYHRTYKTKNLTLEF